MHALVSLISSLTALLGLLPHVSALHFKQPVKVIHRACIEHGPALPQWFPAL